MNILALSLALAASQGSPSLKIDPLLLTQAAETWSVIAQRNNPVWPGWNAAETPLLVYLPGVQDVLINHPKRPSGFVPYGGPVKITGWRILVKNGPTIFDFDGQNTSTDVNGTQTLVVADTLSNRRQWLESLVGQARSSTGDMKQAIDGGLTPTPLDGMEMFAHEAFHVYQHRRAPGKGGNELSLADYPSLSVQNNAGYALESDALKGALAAQKPEELRRAAVKWLAIREDRRSALPKSCADYEDGTEFNEGLAKYVEYRLLHALKGRTPSPQMWLVQGFTGYSDLDPEIQKLISRMGEMMEGRVNVNNDPYGASPVRMRLYFSGMGVGALLDRLGATWHDSIFDKETNLTALARNAIHATPQELEAALAHARQSQRYHDLITTKEKLEQDGLKYIAEAVAEFDRAPGQLILDYSAIAKPRVGLAFTPFGILRVDADRIIYRLLPIRGIVNDLQFGEDSVRPVLQDRRKKQLVLTLTQPITESLLDAAARGWKSGPVQVEELKLPGINLKKVHGTMRLEGNRLTITPKA